MADNPLRCPRCGKIFEPEIITMEILKDYPDDPLILSAWKKSKREKLKQAQEYYDRKDKIDG